MRRTGQALGCHHGTISRELSRNSRDRKAWTGGDAPVQVHGLALCRRQRDRRFKLAHGPDLRALISSKPAMAWSPERIAGRLALEKPSMRISHQAIYRHAYFLSRQRIYWSPQSAPQEAPPRLDRQDAQPEVPDHPGPAQTLVIPPAVATPTGCHAGPWPQVRQVLQARGRPRAQNLFPRSSQPLAEGLHREHERQVTQEAAPQSRSCNDLPRFPPQTPQHDPESMSWLHGPN